MDNEFDPRHIDEAMARFDEFLRQVDDAEAILDANSQEDAAIRGLVVVTLHGYGIEVPYYAQYLQADTEAAEPDADIVIPSIPEPECMTHIEDTGAFHDDTIHEEEAALMYYIESLVTMLGLDEIVDEDDAFLRELSDKFVENAVIDSAITDEQRVALMQAALQLSPVAIQKSLDKWDLKPTLKSLSHRYNPLTVAMISMEQKLVADKEDRNTAVTHAMRPGLEKSIAVILPPEHDDFQRLVQGMEIFIRALLHPAYRPILTDKDIHIVIDRVVDGMNDLFGSLLHRNTIDPKVLAIYALGILPEYRKLGYQA